MDEIDDLLSEADIDRQIITDTHARLGEYATSICQILDVPCDSEAGHRIMYLVQYGWEFRDKIRDIAKRQMHNPS